MGSKSYILDIIEKLNKTINNYKNSTCDMNDTIIIELLKGIAVLEKETATGDIIFNLLKENYFSNELLTANFIDNLYKYEESTLSTYFDIYLEQVYENIITPEEITNYVNNMRGLITQINSNLVSVFNEKLSNYNTSFKL